jgi:UDP-2-acetamido-2,6-beta-L-arabino-hexul-4-ose reductase
MSVVGNGMLAQNIKSSLPPSLQDMVFFASGVSDSTSTNPAEFDREILLLSSFLQSDMHIVYFSTCSIYDPDLVNSPYVRHKLHIENLLTRRGSSSIFRLPQVIGRPFNPATLCNHLARCIREGTHFVVWKHARRYLVDIDDILPIVYAILPSHVGKSVCLNIAPPRNISVSSIVRYLEDSLHTRAIYSLLDNGSSYVVDLPGLPMASGEYSRLCSPFYYRSLIHKYYSEPLSFALATSRYTFH